MKKNLFALFIALLSVGQVFGGTYYAKLKATSSVPADGLVYASTLASEPAKSNYGSTKTSGNNKASGLSSSATVSLYAFAQPARGKKFASWTPEDNKTKVKTNTGIADEITISSNQTSENQNTVVASVTANWTDDSQYIITLKKPQHGSITIKATYYTIVSSKLKEESSKEAISSTADEDAIQFTAYQADKITLSASEGDDGSGFVAWYTIAGEDTTLLTYDREYTGYFDSDKIFYALIAPANESNFLIFNPNNAATSKGLPSDFYGDLPSAIEAAQVSQDKKCIVLVKEKYTLTKSCTIPSEITLLIPFNEALSCYTDMPNAWHGHYNVDEKGNYSASISSTNYYDPSNRDYSNDRSTLYRMLTLAEETTLTIEGILSISADRWVSYATGKSNEQYTGLPNVSGNYRIYQGYGMINMETNSQIIVKSNAKLYCWGRIRGEGTITAESGSEVRECFVFTDRRDEDRLLDYAKDTKCFPMHQSYIQDIQVPITYQHGSRCILVTGVFIYKNKPTESGTMNFVGNAGNNYFIELKEGSSFTKKYDVKTDHLILDLYKGASFNNFKLNSDKFGVAAATDTHIFTINNNWKININSGQTHIAHDLAFAAGAELNINTGASVVVDDNASIYIYDRDDWGAYSTGKTIIPLFLPEYELDNQTTSYAGVTLKDFTASSTYKAIRFAEGLVDASIKVNGTLIIKGGTNAIYDGISYGKSYKVTKASGLYTTTKGANIFSEGNGQIIYEQGAGTQDHIHQQIKYASEVEEVHITPAQLKNADDIEPYTFTDGVLGKSTFKYFSEDGKWKQAWKVTFMNDDEIVDEIYFAQGDDITSPTVQLEKQGYTHTGWSNISDPMGPTDIISEAQWEQIVIKATTIEVTPTEVIKDDVPETSITENTYTIYEQVTADTVKVDEGAAIEITENASVETQTLALSTTPSAINLPDEGQGAIGTSSQIKGKGAINAQNVFIDITMDTSGTLDASKYYAFAVPFAVNVDGGVQQFKNNEREDCIHDKHYRAYTYDGANRALNGKGSNWTLVNTPTFHPGTFYLVEFAPGMGNVYRFTKATESDLNNAANITLKAFASANTADKGWNGIANNALQNASISVSNTDVAQIFDPAQNAFVTVDLCSTQFAIGTPLFVQADGAGKATNSAVSQQTSAPAQMLAQPQTETLGNYTVRIAAENANKMADQLFISASEDAENNYVIGKDLVKMFMGNATTAQLWVNNYDKKLSMHQALLTNGSAEASLTLFAPKAGNYRIYLKETPEDATIYLLENGYVVANLNDDAYYVALTKGENSLYGLRINAKTKADVTTSINDIKTTNSVQKVLFQNKVYIVRNGRLFNTLGQPVK